MISAAVAAPVAALMLWAAAPAAASPRSASLADTGVSVRELAVLGVLLLLAGSTLLLFRRQDVH